MAHPTRRGFLTGLAAGSLALVNADALASALGAGEAGQNEMGMLYDATRCVGCKACMASCKRVNGDYGSLAYERAQFDPDGLWDAPKDLSGSTRTLIKLFKQSDSRRARGRARGGAPSARAPRIVRRGRRARREGREGREGPLERRTVRCSGRSRSDLPSGGESAGLCLAERGTRGVPLGTKGAQEELGFHSWRDRTRYEARASFAFTSSTSTAAIAAAIVVKYGRFERSAFLRIG